MRTVKKIRLLWKPWGALLGVLCFSLAGYGQVFDFIVAKDGSGQFTTINEAIEAAPENGKRSTIFIKKGVYQEKVFIGNRWQSSKKVISLIGEDVETVVITWDDYHGKTISYPGKTGTISADGITAATLTVTSPDFYMENITVKNPAEPAQGQAEAIYQSGDRHVLKNCKLLGNQDTHRTKKGRRYFYYKTTIEGGVDFIYAGGTCYFYQCSIVSNRKGYITAPEDVPYFSTLTNGKALRYGFFFNDCDLVAKPGVKDGEVYLARPWGPDCGSVFMNCRLGSHIHSKGWSGNEPTCSFGEFQNMNADGSELVDVTNRHALSMQLTANDVNTYLLLSKIYRKVSSSPFNAVARVIAPAPVNAIAVAQKKVEWEPVPDVAGYVVYANGEALGSTAAHSYTDTSEHSGSVVYQVKSVGAFGNLSEFDGIADTITEAFISNQIDRQIATPVNQVKKETGGPVFSNGVVSHAAPFSLRIVDVNGRVVFEGQNRNQYNIAHLPANVYILQAVLLGEGVHTQKIRLK